MSREQRLNNKVEFLNGVTTTLFIAGLASLTITLSFAVSGVVKKVTKGYTSWELGLGTALFGASALALSRIIEKTEHRLNEEILESIANSVSHQQEWDRAIWSVPSEEQLERQIPLSTPSTPSYIKARACLGCKHYKGVRLEGEKGVNWFVCAMHPYGPGDISDPTLQPNSCKDWEGRKQLYRIIRLQGSGITNLWVCPADFVEDGEEPIPEDVASVIEDSYFVNQEDARRLIKHFGVTSINGLIGQTFESTRLTAWAALLDLTGDFPD